jgi:VIT1/CCC1 family predicted Fe2+/Mn2+ transporter
MAPVIAALVTGAALALIGAVIAFIGYKKFKKSTLKT